MAGTITKRMNSVVSKLQDLFPQLYCKQDFFSMLDDIKAAKPDRRSFELRKLVNELRAAGVKCEYGKSDLSYYKKIIEESDLLEDTDAINRIIVEVLKDAYEDFPRPEEFMQRIVAEPDEEIYVKESLALRILKRFLVTVNVKENKKYYSKTLARVSPETLEESVFDVLLEKPDGRCDYLRLVQAAKSLAEGKFVSPVTTKELLFLTAFAYDMRYYSSTEDSDYDVRRDVKKNLFEDYYCDNLTRYLYEEDGGKSGNSDTEPTGLGLNLKNFVDVTFIYYLNRLDLTPSEKVAGFYKMTERVKTAWNAKHAYLDARRVEYESTATRTYKENLAAVIGAMSEEELLAHLLEGYYCDLRYVYTSKESGALRETSKGIFEFQVVNNSAYLQYSELLSRIKEKLGIDREINLGMLDLRKGEDKVIADSSCELELTRPAWDESYFVSLGFSAADLRKFFAIFQKINQRLDPYEVLSITDAKDMTRTKLIAACYYMYYLDITERETRYTRKSFKEVYSELSCAANQRLMAAEYQEFSTKNLFDVFVAFFAYCTVNTFWDDEGLSDGE